MSVLDVGRLLLALGLPWLVGIALVRIRWRDAGEGAWAMAIGYGAIFGALIVTLIMRGLAAAGVPWTFTWLVAIQVGLLVLFVALGRGVPVTGWAGGFVTPTWRAMPGWVRIVWLVAAIWLTLRVANLAAEAMLRPLYPWDGWIQWATKARVWFEHRTLLPFVHFHEWVGADPTKVFTDAAPIYPATVPLLQTYTCIALGRWDDALMNLPFVQCGVALLFAFYGQARLAGAAPWLAMLGTYLVGTIPFLNIHVALAGYADLHVAVVFGMAVMALAVWSWTRDPRQLLFAIALTVALPFIKRPGVVWALMLLPVMLVALKPRLGLIAVVIGMLAGAGVLFFLAQTGATVLGYRLNDEISSVTQPLLANLLLMGNWNLIFFLAVVVMLVAWREVISPRMLPYSVLILQSVTFLAVVFYLSMADIWVSDYSTVNRAVIHAVPMLVFYLTLLAHEWSGGYVERMQPKLAL